MAATEKITIDTVKNLLSKHLTDLTENESKIIGDVLTIDFSDINKQEHSIKFKMMHGGNTAYVKCFINSNASMSSSKPKVVNGISNMISWGGCFSLASVINIFRNHYCKSYEFDLSDREGYEKGEWPNIMFAINELIEAA